MKYILTTLLLFTVSVLQAQDIKIKINETESLVSDVPGMNQEVKKFFIKTTTNTGRTYTVHAENLQKTFTGNGTYKELDFGKDIRDVVIEVKDGNTSITTFTIAKGEGGEDDTDVEVKVMLPHESASQFILQQLGSNMNFAPVGIQIPNVSAFSKFTGNQYAHVFFDQNGNTLLRSLPVGIEKAQYIAHIIYLVPKDAQQSVEFRINQTAADVSEIVAIRGDGGKADIIKLVSEKQVKEMVMIWQHYEIPLTPSSEDIQFDIVRNGYKIEEGALKYDEAKVVATRTIKIKKLYHGSFDIGIINTELKNPSFSHVTSEVDPNEKVVRRTNYEDRMLASAQYTLYLSLWAAVKKALHMPITGFRVSGRSYVQDHGLFERIYPTFGIGITEKPLDNIFLGLNWEIIRGVSIFGGRHFGKVNTFEETQGFKFSDTFISEEAFQLRQDTKRKSNWSFGLNLDVRIITNLFQNSSAGS